MDQWCSTREEGSTEQDKSPGQSSGMLGNAWCLAGWTQQARERLQGLGELHRKDQEPHPAAAGIGRKEGWVDVNEEPNWK